MEEEYIPVKKSQVNLLKKTPLYYFSKDGEPLLYKKDGITLDVERIQLKNYPELFIHKSYKQEASKELYKTLNISLARAISAKGLATIKALLCEVVEEALNDSLGTSFDMLPETLEILFQGYSENKSLLESLTLISSSSSLLTNHTVNVLALTMHYCIWNKFSDAEIKILGICAILHDIGLTKIERAIVETDEQLTDIQFEQFKTHTLKGYKIINNLFNFEKEIALVALEHHEKLDGSGYPKGMTDISDAAHLIGLIDSYEYMAYRDKKFRRAQKPFGAMQILKKDVMAGKYNKKMFVELCSCLTR
ncbi:MAG: HD domain-containing protein [Desulfamplus sp.]|nr:HD domain-containing protein [Desulfamplus sp.]MBF0413939.1 HD domain-containing protein [Desulfamplus sp.]